MEKIAVLFPSQSADYHQMGKSIYDNYNEVKELFAIANRQWNCQFEDYIFRTQKNESEWNEFRIPSVFLTSIAFYNTFIHTYQMEPDYFIGDGVGRLTALTCAGVITFEDAIHYLYQVNSFLKENEIINEEQLVLPQQQELMEQFIAIPIHSEQKRKKVIEHEERIPWEEINHFIDIGPSREAGNKIKKYSEQQRVCYLDYPGDGYYPLAIFQTKKLFNRQYLIGKMLAVAVSVENINFNDEEYREGVSVPYNKIKAMYDKYHGVQSAPSNQEISEATSYLIQIMKTKGTVQEEIIDRLKQLESEILIMLS